VQPSGFRVFETNKKGDNSMKKAEKVLWLINVPVHLDNEVKEFVKRNYSSKSSFIRKSMRYLIEDDKAEPTGKRKVGWLFQVDQKLHKQAIDLIKTNYSSKTTFLVYAVTRQLIAEHYMEEKTKTLIIENKKLRHSLTEKEADNTELAEIYFTLLRKFRHLKLEKSRLEKDLKEANSQSKQAEVKPC
jgi:metal-responsive CopG/Arc/MetJ family transcriptional regulator